MRPIIGITSAWSVETWGDSIEEGGYYYVGKPYIEAIYKFGGIPLVIPLEADDEEISQSIPNLLQQVDGILFSGGGDAKRFLPHQLPTLREQQPKRYDFEKKLMKEAWQMKKPVLGICRGFQMMAEVFGGTISENIVECHRQNIPGYLPWHKVLIEPETKISEIIGQLQWEVNSFHRQVIGRLPEGFIVNITSEDGIIEGIEACHHPFFIGFQFHPEELLEKDKLAGNLIKKFINTAKDNKIINNNL